jgi:DNA-binding NtrC family response regulator
MVAATNQRSSPFGLVVTGEANTWQQALDQIVGPEWLTTLPVESDRQLLEVVRSGAAQAAVLDEEAPWELDVLQVLRMIRRLDAAFPVVVVTRRTDRRWLQDALRLAAFSVVVKPLELEALLRQIQRMMVRLDQMLRDLP